MHVCVFVRKREREREREHVTFLNVKDWHTSPHTARPPSSKYGIVYTLTIVEGGANIPMNGVSHFGNFKLVLDMGGT